MADTYIISSIKKNLFAFNLVNYSISLHVSFLKTSCIILGFIDLISLEQVCTEMSCSLNLIFPSLTRWRPDHFSVPEYFLSVSLLENVHWNKHQVHSQAHSWVCLMCIPMYTYLTKRCSEKLYRRQSSPLSINRP